MSAANFFFGTSEDEWDPHAYTPEECRRDPLTGHVYCAEPYTTQATRGLEDAEGDGTYTPESLPLLDIQTNPVEYLGTHPAFPGVVSPAYQAMGENIEAHQPQPEDAMCHQITSKELFQVRENLGMDMAQQLRQGYGAGAGVHWDPSTQDYDPTSMQGGYTMDQPVSMSGEEVGDGLYDQGFISMGSVPAVNVGVFTDPLTGQKYQAYEAAMPPPDADYELEMSNDARDASLARLQGGWTNDTPRPSKREILDDGYHMQYDRGIREHGMVDRSRQEEYARISNQFNWDDEHPDDDGPTLVGIPANMLMGGNQNVAIRPSVYIAPTNRGNRTEAINRGGYTFEETAAARDETVTAIRRDRTDNTRMDGGGIHAVGQYDGFKLQEEVNDQAPTQRSQHEHLLPYAGQMTATEGGRVEQVNAPTNMVGGMRYHDVIRGHQAATDGHTINEFEYVAPNALHGTQYQEHGTNVQMHHHPGGAAPTRAEALENPTAKHGTQYHDQHYGGIQGHEIGHKSQGYVVQGTSKGVFGNRTGNAVYNETGSRLTQVSNEAGHNKHANHGVTRAVQAPHEAYATGGQRVTNSTVKGGNYANDRVIATGMVGGTWGYAIQNPGTVVGINDKREHKHNQPALATWPTDDSARMTQVSQVKDDRWQTNQRMYTNFQLPAGGDAGNTFDQEMEQVGR